MPQPVLEQAGAETCGGRLRFRDPLKTSGNGAWYLRGALRHFRRPSPLVEKGGGCLISSLENQLHRYHDQTRVIEY